jgi:hypothetical protein
LADSFLQLVGLFFASRQDALRAIRKRADQTAITTRGTEESKSARKPSAKRKAGAQPDAVDARHDRAGDHVDHGAASFACRFRLDGHITA